MESFLDELAHAAGQDPLDLPARAARRRTRATSACSSSRPTKAGWGTPLPAGRARGVAVHDSFGSFVAQVAEVSVEDGQIRVHRVVCAIDCGVVVNPAGVVAQMESAHRLRPVRGAARRDHAARRARSQQSNFHDYQVLRMDEMPVVEVHIVPSGEKPGGVGEPGMPPIAPAVANAVFALTGKRLRRLPMRLA